MDFSQIYVGFQTAFQPSNLFFCFVGVVLGQIVGILPGLGPAAAIALLMPASFALSPATAIIMLAGVYYGSMYGGTITSVLLNVPGEAASVVTCLDGYQMARKGRAGPALGIAAFGSFIAGTLGTIALSLVGPSLAEIALDFGPPEHFALMLLGMMSLVIFVSGSILKGLSMAALGVIIGAIGMDVISGRPRFTFGLHELMDGVGLIPVIMGLFGIAEVMLSVEEMEQREIFDTKIKDMFPTRTDWADSFWPILRGTVIGFFLGILPGSGGVIASFASYAAEKKFSPHPEKFGTGMIEGVAGPESANNSAAAGGFVPLLALGIPPTVVMALLLGALLIHGVQPGPMLFKLYPNVVWGVIISMYIGNVMLLLLNIPAIPLWVWCLKVPYQILFPLIILFCLIGAYSLNYSVVEVYFMIFFGFLGYLMKKFKYEPAPLILALVLTPMFENALRQSLIISRGDPIIFFQRPISLGFILAAIAMLLLPVFSAFRSRRAILLAARAEEEDQ
jgi:putative tricarboxylic transport membrane protein